MKAGIDGGLAKKKRPKPRGKPKRRRHKKKQKGSSSFVWYSTTKVPLVLILNRYCVNFSNKDYVQKVINVNSVMIQMLDVKLSRKIYTLIVDKKKKENDTMDNWDEEKLRKVILSKHGNPKTTTEKVCKFFIEAVENGKYGWFWVCLMVVMNVNINILYLLDSS